MTLARGKRLSPAHRRLLEEDERVMLSLGLARSTRAGQRGTARKFLELIRRRIDRVRREDVERFLASRASQVTGTTVVGDFYRLRSFFRNMIQLGHVSKSPLDGMHCAPAASPAQLLLPEKQVQRLLSQASVPRLGGDGRPVALRDRALLELLYGAGLRSCEACRVKPTDLDLGRGELAVRPAKGGTPRRVPLPDAALPHLESYLKAGRPLLDGGRGRDQGALLLSRLGCPLKTDAVRLILKGVVRRLGGTGGGRDPYPHAFRRAIATHLARSGASVLAVKELLGHRELATTQLYLEVEWGDLVKAVGAVELRPKK